MDDKPKAFSEPAPPSKRERHEGFSMRCPGCDTDLDIYEDNFSIPPHPMIRHPEDRPAYPTGGRFPAMPIGIVGVSRLCKYSGAILTPRIR